MIILENVSKEYRSGRGRIKALKGVSFKVEDGSTVAVFGKSGSGKTTLLNCIGGLDRPETGNITCFGTDIHTLTEKALCLFQRRNLGFVFQQGNLLKYLTVFQNIAFPLALNGFDKKSIGKRVNQLLEITELAGAGTALPEELSGGEAQRVAFARAVAHFPRLILADEPTASLDSETGKNLVRFMFETGMDQKCIMIIATHDSEIMDLAKVRISVRDGEIIMRE